MKEMKLVVYCEGIKGVHESLVEIRDWNNWKVITSPCFTFGKSFGLMMECTKRVQRREQNLKLQVVLSLGAEDKELLKQILHEEKDFFVLEAAAKVAGKIKDKEFVAPLLALVKQEDMSVFTKGAAIRALGRIRDERAIPTLQQKASSYDATVRNAAIWALAQMEHKDAIKTAIDCVHKANKRTRQSVFSALARKKNCVLSQSALKKLSTQYPEAKKLLDKKKNRPL